MTAEPPPPPPDEPGPPPPPPDGASPSSTAPDLVAAGAVRDGWLVKVLGGGDVDIKLEITADAWSGSAKEKIEAAGGSLTAR